MRCKLTRDRRLLHMSRYAPILILVCGLALAGCAGTKYPMLTTLSAADAGAMTCSQLHAQRLVAEDTAQQIAQIAQGGRPRFSPPMNTPPTCVSKSSCGSPVA